MSLFPINYYYKLQASHSDRYLGIVHARGIANLDGRYHHGADSGELYQLSGDPSDETTKFLLLPVDQEYVAIVPRKASNVIDVQKIWDPITLGLVAAGVGGRSVILYPWNGGDNQCFKFAAVGGDAYMIHERNNPGAVFDVQGAARDGAPIIVYSPNGGRHQQFRVTRNEEIPVNGNPKGYPRHNPESDALPTPEPKTFDMPPATDHAVYIGHTIIPFLFVNDPAYDRVSQATYCPLYVLRRERMWKQQPEHFKSADPAPSEKISRKVTTGVTQETKNKVDSNLKMELVPKFGFKSVGPLAGLDMTINAELKHTSEDNLTLQQSIEETVERETPANVKYAISVWSLVDRYTLARVMLNRATEAERTAEKEAEESVVFVVDIALRGTSRIPMVTGSK